MANTRAYGTLAAYRPSCCPLGGGDSPPGVAESPTFGCPSELPQVPHPYKAVTQRGRIGPGEKKGNEECGVANQKTGVTAWPASDPGRSLRRLNSSSRPVPVYRGRRNR